jgi:hypothetical protein
MAVIDPSVLAAGSGGVVLTSDISMWLALSPPLTPPIGPLVQNTIAFLAGPKALCDGTHP